MNIKRIVSGMITAVFVFTAGFIPVKENKNSLLNAELSASALSTVIGDLSDNGEIDLYDAIEISKVLINLRTLTPEEVVIADYNEDKVVDLYDVIDIAKYLVKNASHSTSLSTYTVYTKLIEMKSKYPEGTPWTNANGYAWKGGIYSMGYGCAGFAFMLSDNAFGSLPARMHTNFSAIKVGDILRLNNDTHSVIVLKREGNIITVAEGNYNSSVHWGRQIDLSDKSYGFTNVLTRYPE